MKSFSCSFLWLTGGLSLSVWACLPAASQTTNHPAAATTTVSKIAPPPPLPPAKSPVDFFRELLAMKSAERQQALTNRAPEAQKLILAKVREYEAMRPNLRELRLRLTELHFYLLPLMRVPPEAQAAQLANIPDEDRKLVEERLREWDKLSPATQKELLDNYATIRWLEGGAEPPRPEGLQAMSAAARQTLEPGLRKWQSLSDEQRQAIMRRFNQFFELTSEEKGRVLKTLSEPERKQIEQTLDEFTKLSAVQRAQCLASFQKFVNLSPEERREFMKTAERWKLMTPDQRQAWKNLVSKLPPPLPGLDEPPPMPREAARSRPGVPVATNSN